MQLCVLNHGQLVHNGNGCLTFSYMIQHILHCFFEVESSAEVA